MSAAAGDWHSHVKLYNLLKMCSEYVLETYKSESDSSSPLPPYSSPPIHANQMFGYFFFYVPLYPYFGLVFGSDTYVSNMFKTIIDLSFGQIFFLVLNVGTFFPLF